MSTFDCHRISSNIVVKHGRRQFLVTGSLADRFFINPIIGVCQGLEAALFHYAVINGYDLVVAIDRGMIPRFAKPEMEALWTKVIDRKTKDDNGVAWSPQRSRRTTRSTEISQVVDQATSSAASRSTNILEKIAQRLIPSLYKSFIILVSPNELIETGPDGNLTAESLRQLQTIRTWATISPGNVDTCSVLLIDESQMDAYKALYKRGTYIPKEYINDNVKIGPPDCSELEGFLTRLKYRYGLRGNVPVTAREIMSLFFANNEQKINGLYNVTEVIRRKWPKEPKSIEAFFTESKKQKRKVLAEALKELDSMVGLDRVREKIKELQNLAKYKIRVIREGRSFSSTLHSIFLGSPGTGKTVVARLLGRIYYGLGLCSRNVFVEISKKDITSSYNPGDAVKNMEAKIQEAMGGVLFVDEAYEFAEDDWLREAFGTLMKMMEDHRDSLIVILAGYKNRLKDLYNINDGIESRFPHKLEFPDYTTQELMQMLKNQLAKEGFLLTSAAESKAVEFIDKKTQIGKFANGRGVRTLREKMVAGAVSRESTTSIEEKDVPGIEKQQTVDEILEELDRKFVGLASVKTQIRRIAKRIEVDTEEGIGLGVSANRNYNMAFVGPPGTGKTTIARYMARVFNSMGLIEGTEIIETSPNNMQAEYLGQTGGKVEALFKQAREEGNVLFIDEAYAFYPKDSHNAGGDYRREALETLIQQITLEKNAGTVVIMAGYKEEMDWMLNHANPGLKRRIPYIVDFPNFSVEECLEILLKHLETQNKSFDQNDWPQVERQLKELIACQRRSPNFGNAGEMVALAEELINNYAVRDGHERGILTLEDVQILSPCPVYEESLERGIGQ